MKLELKWKKMEKKKVVIKTRGKHERSDQRERDEMKGEATNIRGKIKNQNM